MVKVCYSCDFPFIFFLHFLDLSRLFVIQLRKSDTSNTIIIMSNKTSFSNQIEVMSGFSKVLETFCMNLEEGTNLLEQSLTSSYNKGLMDEIYLVLKGRSIARITSDLRRLSDKIIAEDISFLETEIDFMTTRMESYNLNEENRESEEL